MWWFSIAMSNQEVGDFQDYQAECPRGGWTKVRGARSQLEPKPKTTYTNNQYHSFPSVHDSSWPDILKVCSLKLRTWFDSLACHTHNDFWKTSTWGSHWNELHLWSLRVLQGMPRTGCNMSLKPMVGWSKIESTENTRYKRISIISMVAFGKWLQMTWFQPSNSPILLRLMASACPRQTEKIRCCQVTVEQDPFPCVPVGNGQTSTQLRLNQGGNGSVTPIYGGYDLKSYYMYIYI